MHILFITETPDRPTIETFIDLHKRKIQLTVICKKDSEFEYLLIEQGIKIRNLVIKKNIEFSVINKLRNIVTNDNIDLVHTYTNKALSNAIFSLLGRKTRLIAYRGIVGNVSFLDPISWLRFLNPKIDRIICVCDAIKDHFLEMRPRFLVMPADRPVTVYKGHKLEWYKENPANLENFGVSEGVFVVGCIANSRPRKGVEYLIEALDFIPPEIPICLLLVGRMQGKNIDKAISRSQKKQHIFTPGFCDNAPAISAACDVVCLPSIKREGLPRSIIEAMAYGTPPIVTNSGGSPELVEHEKSGLVVPIKDAKSIAKAIIRLYYDNELRELYGKNAKERIKNDFSSEATTDKTLAIYKQLLS
jgi:glycosyltransferase involved in cell wall biosynthesis|tara:strand:+ start:25025 stop:26104 length:1080 start_codon:yes stop_codon:yes gene_type:complete